MAYTKDFMQTYFHSELQRMHDYGDFKNKQILFAPTRIIQHNWSFNDFSRALAGVDENLQSKMLYVVRKIASSDLL